MRAVRLPAALAVAVAVPAVSGRAEKSGGDAKGSDSMLVTASDTACEVSRKDFPAGHVKLAVENKGSKVTEPTAPDMTAAPSWRAPWC